MTNSHHQRNEKQRYNQGNNDGEPFNVDTVLNNRRNDLASDGVGYADTLPKDNIVEYIDGTFERWKQQYKGEEFEQGGDDGNDKKS